MTTTTALPPPPTTQDSDNDNDNGQQQPMIGNNSCIIPVSVMFFRYQFIASMIWWILVRLLMKKQLYDITYGSVFTCPSWFPSPKILHILQKPKNRKLIFISSLVALLIGGGGGCNNSSYNNNDNNNVVVMMVVVVVRFAIFMIISLYHLIESSVTHRHGEYPLLYNTWAMCYFFHESSYAIAVSWGVAIHFIFSTGLSKLLVSGGWNHWTDPYTMKFYLTLYHQAKQGFSRPFLPNWNRWICQSRCITKSISIMTILLECILIPLTLILPSNWKWWIGCYGMIIMHIGIFLFMSKKVGIVFFSTLPTYIIGFYYVDYYDNSSSSSSSSSSSVECWWITVAVAFLPTIIAYFVRYRWRLPNDNNTEILLLPENWPSSPVSLFMWSGHQAQILAETLMTKDTRVVMGTSDKTPYNIVGLPVIHHGAVAPPPPSSSQTITSSSSRNNNIKEADPAVHDCVLRVIGFTLLHHQLSGVIPQPPPTRHDDDGRQRLGDDDDDDKNHHYYKSHQWDVNAFVKTLQTFLESERRLYETQSGLPLANAFFVRLDGNGNVEKVLHSSCP